MSETTQPAAVGPALRLAREPREDRWRQPPIWLWGLAVGLQVLAAAALTNFTFPSLIDIASSGRIHTLIVHEWW